MTTNDTKTREFEFDTQLGIGAQARAVLHLLSGSPLESSSILWLHTFAWYNGREKGFSIHAPSADLKSNLYITCAEYRSSDQLEVSHWVGKTPLLNPPTSDDRPEAAWKSARRFEYGDIRGAAEYILVLIKSKAGE